MTDSVTESQVRSGVAAMGSRLASATNTPRRRVQTMLRGIRRPSPMRSGSLAHSASIKLS